MKHTFPVVLFLYKRPAASKKILNLIIKAKIKKIYIFADGPKNTQEKIITNQIKSLINSYSKKFPSIKFIPNFAPKNLGLKNNIVNGLNQVFKTESAAIILEDDCIPNLDFFNFTSQMLVKYKNNEKIMSVAGTSVGRFSKQSYTFSRYQLCWGFGTWKRAWSLYDSNLSRINQKQNSNIFTKTWPNLVARWYWKNIFTKTKQNIIKTWDYHWTFAHILNKGFAIIPSTNLITNIGFDQAATHTKVKSTAASMKTLKLDKPLIHPTKINENIKTTKAIEKRFYLHPVAILGMIKIIIKSLLKKS